MSLPEGLTCKNCRKGRLNRKDVSQEFEREGLKLKIEGIPAFVCDHCGRPIFDPDTLDHVANAADELFAVSGAKRSGKYKTSMSKKRPIAAATKSASASRGKAYTRPR